MKGGLEDQVSTVYKHVRELWPRWTLLPALPFVGWGLFWIIRGQVRWDHVLMMTVIPLLAYWNGRTKRLYLGLLPFFFTGVIYDASRFVRGWGLTETSVHVCDLWAIEKAIFGVPVGGTRVALSDYFYQHHVLALDLLCSVPYFTYFLVPLGYGVYLYFRDYRRLQQLGWAFLLLTVAAMITWHLYPAAPPWYVRTNGCAVDLGVENSAGAALLRVDAWLGFGFFEGMYGRAAAVFGAMPSLHVGYQMLTALVVWRHHGWGWRGFFVGFYFAMCFAAVYLDHHWVVDLAVGSAYAVAAKLLIWRLVPAIEAEGVSRAVARDTAL